jgi:hypothetical protein
MRLLRDEAVIIGKSAKDIRISDELLIILNDWGLNQSGTPVQEEQSPVPTPEESKIIEELKRKGLI